MKHGVDKQIQEIIVAAYLSGMTGPELARQYHITVPTVYAYVRRHGGTVLTHREILVARNRARGAIIDEGILRQLIDEALSIAEIAARLGVTRPTIAMKMRRMGQRSKHGRGSPMEKNYFWKGGRTIDVDGYVLLKVPGHPFADNRGYVREHRLVMEGVLGRYLAPEEVVHHKLGVAKNDNHPDNLEVFQTNAEHLRHELTGKKYHMTPQGLQRKRESVQRVNQRRYSATHAVSKTDVAL